MVVFEALFALFRTIFQHPVAWTEDIFSPQQYRNLQRKLFYAGVASSQLLTLYFGNYYG